MNAHAHGHDHFHSHSRETKPVWTSSSFLVYAGGLTVLIATVSALGYLATQYSGGFARTAWAFLLFFVLLSIATSLRVANRWLAAGIFAFTTVFAWGAFVGSAWAWFGWLDGSRGLLEGWSFGRLSLEFLILIFALGTGVVWRFPFITLISATFAWLFVTDFISNGGWWTYLVSLAIGLLYLSVGSVSDAPSTFWLHFVGGLLIGVPILHWFHSSHFDFFIVLVGAFFYVGIGYATRRSSWTVFGTIGFFIATTHYAGGSPTPVPGGGIFGFTPAASYGSWQTPLAFGLLGFWLVLLGLAGRRPPRHDHMHAAPPAPVPAPAE